MVKSGKSLWDMDGSGAHPESPAQYACRIIREATIQGQIKPGTWLRQIQLAEGLGVSQGTARQALGLLASEGLLVAEPYKGYRVPAMDVEDVRDLFELCATIEGFAVELAASRITDADLDELGGLHEKTRSAGAQNDRLATTEAWLAFVLAALSVSKRPRLLRVILQQTDVQRCYDNSLSWSNQQWQGKLKHWLSFQIDLMQALRAGDGKRARSLVEEHYRQLIEMSAAATTQSED
jgi:DNA-binding GntR family transcriptional regulator